eukprot:11637663-Heterocapsa_arctica.AAC.1
MGRWGRAVVCWLDRMGREGSKPVDVGESRKHGAKFSSRAVLALRRGIPYKSQEGREVQSPSYSRSSPNTDSLIEARPLGFRPVEASDASEGPKLQRGQ